MSGELLARYPHPDDFRPQVTSHALAERLGIGTLPKADGKWDTITGSACVDLRKVLAIAATTTRWWNHWHNKMRETQASQAVDTIGGGRSRVRTGLRSANGPNG